MARSTLHTRDALLDAALEVHAAGGSRAVTMSAVARAAGAPSGSVYHRFPDRGSMLAGLWRRTAGQFEAEYLDALGEAPTAEAAVRATVWIVEWCRREPARAAVLHAGPTAFAPDTWPKELVAEHQQAVAKRDAEIGHAIRTIAAATGVAPDEAAFAMFDLPLGVVGQHLRVPEPVPLAAVDLVGRLAARLLST